MHFSCIIFNLPVQLLKNKHMKKLLLILFIGLSTFSNAQNSIQPSFGFNLWNLAESDMISYMEVGATYEHGLSDQLGIIRRVL